MPLLRRILKFSTPISESFATSQIWKMKTSSHRKTGSIKKARIIPELILAWLQEIFPIQLIAVIVLLMRSWFSPITFKSH